MSKIAVVYWSGTGNTEQMANAVAEGIQAAGGTAALLGPGEFTAADVAAYDALAFGCPAMGAEQLEEGEFEPMFSAVEGSLNGKRIALFGSYGWGSGEWMQDWAERCRQAGAVLLHDEGLAVNEAPDDEALDACRDLGRASASG